METLDGNIGVCFEISANTVAHCIEDNSQALAAGEFKGWN